MSKPETAFKIGSVRAAVFVNQGEQGSFRTATVIRRYKDGAGEWKDSDSYSLPQLLALREVVDDTISYLKANESNGGDVSD